MQSIRQMIRHLKGWIADLKEKKAVLLESLGQAREAGIFDLKFSDIKIGLDMIQWMCHIKALKAYERI